MNILKIKEQELISGSTNRCECELLQQRGLGFLTDTTARPDTTENTCYEICCTQLSGNRYKWIEKYNAAKEQKKKVFV